MTLALPAVVVSVAVFAALLFVPDRRRGTVLAQGALLLGGVLFFVILGAGPVGGIEPRGLATVAVGLLSAASAGMLYHLYLGRFAELRVARGVFVGVYLALTAVYAVLFLSLI